MKNNVSNIVLIVINSIEIVFGILACTFMFPLGALMFLFSGLDGASDERLSSALMILFLIAMLIAACASLIINILCIIERKRNQKMEAELSKGKRIASVSLGGVSLVFMAICIVAFIFVLK
ncbi:MAG: hypothetical protein K5776_10480 [Lachnospiraceae bacterium]|nr:hypothetical protein [Lachnospiraceae bacterium]